MDTFFPLVACTYNNNNVYVCSLSLSPSDFSQSLVVKTAANPLLMWCKPVHLYDKEYTFD